jgi:hypothetical protein
MYADLPDACRELLDLQGGVIARWQAATAGLPPHVIDTRLRQGRWQSLYRGSYATFTGEPPRLSVLWAAALRGGPEAVLSHQTAAEIDGLVDRPARLIHVSVPPDRQVAVAARERHPGSPGLRIHRSTRLAETRHPLLTPPRTRIEETAVDLARHSADLDEALSWLTAACGRRLTTTAKLRTALEAHARMPWRLELTAALDDVGDGVLSVLEYRYVRHAERAHGLPKARRQRRRASGRRAQYLDNLYEEYLLAVELDGQASHPVAGRWADIRRDNASTVSGVFTLRYGWADVTGRPCSVAAEVAMVLRIRGWTGQVTPCSPQCPISSVMAGISQSL